MKYEVAFRKHFSGSLNIAKINKPFAKIVIVVTIPRNKRSSMA